MLRIAIIDNDMDAAKQMEAFIHRYAQTEGLAVSVAAFDRADKFLSRYEPIYDIIFMEIELPGLDGMEAARRLRRKDSDVVLVFVTAFARHAIRGYEVDALDFVLKPLSFYAFSVKLERSIQRIRTRTGIQIALKPPTASTAWKSARFTIWKPEAGCSTTTPPPAFILFGAVCKAPSRSWAAIPLPSATNAIW